MKKAIKIILIVLICIAAYFGFNLCGAILKNMSFPPDPSPSRSIEYSIDSGLFIQEYEISSSSLPDSVLNNVLCFKHTFTEFERLYSHRDWNYYINSANVVLNFQHTDRTRHLFVYDRENDEKGHASWSVHGNAQYSGPFSDFGRTCFVYRNGTSSYSRDSTIILDIGQCVSPGYHGWIKLSPANNTDIVPVCINDRLPSESESFDSVIGNRLSYYGDYFLKTYEPCRYPESSESYLPVRIPSHHANKRKERLMRLFRWDGEEMTGKGCARCEQEHDAIP